jgi:two-component system, sensor histidine kinase and response regulator
MNEKILIVDDLPQNIQVAATTLIQAGYNISFAQNGKDAIKLCQNHDFDLILLDIMMPEMDGIEVCKQLKSEPRFYDLPIIFLTAKNDTESITQAFEAGGVDFVQKPFKGSELILRVKTHITIKLQKEELKKLNATKDKFFSIIAHDLKGPFTGLLGFTELLVGESDNTPPEQLKLYYNLLHQSAKQGYNLLNNLLEWSRTQRESIQILPEKFELNSIIQDVLELLNNNIQNKSITIQVKGELSQKVNADKNMTHTVLRNLISNAIKFTNHNKQIEIILSANETHAIIEIKDEGIGMTEETMSNLFQIDKNVSRKGTNDEPGTGLGLIICKEFIEANHGEIWINSIPGNGSSFFFSLPL